MPYRPSFPSRPYDPTKKKVISHDATKTTLDGDLTVEITVNGKVILTQGNDVEYDQIEIKAATIFRIAGLLNETKNVKYVDRNDS